MGFRNGAYAKVWKIENDNGHSIKAQISTSRKNKKTEEYETDFNSYALFSGGAYEAAKKLKDGDRVHLGDVEVRNKYDKEKRVTYTDYFIWSLQDMPDSGSEPKHDSQPSSEDSSENNASKPLPY